MRRIITLLAATVIALLLGMGSARAHSELISSSPAAESDLDLVPASIELVFNQKIQDQFAYATLTGPDGTQISRGEPSVQGERVLLPVQAGGGSGQYTVAYRVISEDGHPISGTYSFTVALPASPVAQKGTASAATATAAAAADTEESGSGSSLMLPILGGGVALLFLVGMMIVLRGERRK